MNDIDEILKGITGHVIEIETELTRLKSVIDKCSDIVTCVKYQDNTKCVYAFDRYNTDGDCLAEK